MYTIQQSRVNTRQGDELTVFKQNINIFCTVCTMHLNKALNIENILQF